jgi:alpha-1,6-mannosyltransferase
VRNARAIYGCMAVGVVLSIARAMAAGTLATQGTREMLWPFATFGVVAAVAGWAHLRTRPEALSWKQLFAAALAIHLIAALSLPFTASDLWSNTAYGRLSVMGINPYAHGPSALPVGDWARAMVHPMWIDLPLPYGPLVAALQVGAGAAPEPVSGMVIWKLEILAISLIAVFVAARFLRAHYTDAEAKARFVLFAWCPLFAWELAGQAHNDAPLVLALIGFVWAATVGREVLALAFLALGIAAKFVAAPVAGLYLVMIARRNPLRGVLLGAALGAFTVATMLPFWHGWSTLSGLWTNIGPVYGHSTRSLGDLVHLCAEPFGARADLLAFRIFTDIGLVASAAVAILGIVRARTTTSVIHYGMLFLLVGDLFTQVWFQPWYITWLLALALGHPDGRWLRLMALYAALTLVTYIVPIDPLDNVIIDFYIGWRLLALVRTPETVFVP